MSMIASFIFNNCDPKYDSKYGWSNNKKIVIVVPTDISWFGLKMHQCFISSLLNKCNIQIISVLKDQYADKYEQWKKSDVIIGDIETITNTASQLKTRNKNKYKKWSFNKSQRTIICIMLNGINHERNKEFDNFFMNLGMKRRPNGQNMLVISINPDQIGIWNRNITKYGDNGFSKYAFSNGNIQSYYEFFK